jgi:hypothetical protein
MADVKITALPLATSITAENDVLPLVTGGGATTNKATLSQITTAALNATPVTPAQGGTGLTSLGTNVATFLGTPSSANLASAVLDETGTGALVFANTPTLVTPILGTPASGTLTNCLGLLGTGITFTGLTAATLPLVGTETLMINDGTSNKKTTVASLQSATAYGELYVAGGSVTQTSNATPETYNKLTCFATAGLSNLTTPSAANDSVTVTTAGVYQISFFNTFTSSNSKIFRFRLFNETTNTAYANTVVSCSTASTNPTFVAYSAIVSAAAGNVLSVQFTSSTNSETLTITDANISVVRVATA